MEIITKSLIYLLLLLSLISTVFSYECYVCKDQEDNKDKCIETVQTCQVDHDRCLTEVRWETTPYWAPSGLKQYYISKRCANESMCDQLNKKYLKKCDRIWYNDWACVECCSGERCNSYVTLASENVYPQLISLILPLILGIWFLI